MSEGSVPKIVTKRRRFGKVLVKTKRARDNSCYLSDLKRVGKSGSIMVARRSKKHLSFIHKSAEGLRVNDLISVPLKLRAYGTRNVRTLSALGVSGQESITRKRRFFTLCKYLTHIFIKFMFHVVPSLQNSRAAKNHPRNINIRSKKQNIFFYVIFNKKF